MILSLGLLVLFVRNTIANGKQWPTLGGNNQDNFHVLTHQANAFNHISSEMRKQARTRKYPAPAVASTTTTQPFTHQCEKPKSLSFSTNTSDNSKGTGTERQQSKPRIDWNLEVVIKHKKKDGNLFTEKNIKAMKELTDVFYKDKKFSDYCWKKEEGKCYYSRNPINHFFPSISTNELSKINGEEIYMSESQKNMMNGMILKHINSPCKLSSLASIMPAKTKQAWSLGKHQEAKTQLAGDLAKACTANPCSDGCVQLCKPAFKCMDCQQCLTSGGMKDLPALVCPTYLGLCAKSVMCNVKSVSGLPGKVAVFDGIGKDFAPCVLNSTLLNKHASKAKDLPLCQMPHLYMDEKWVPTLKNCMSIKSNCSPPAYIASKIEENSCSLCNAEHCKCASDGYGNAMNSIMQNMIHDKMGKSNIGKEFKAGNMKTNVVAFQIFFGAPLKGFDNSTHGDCSGFGCVGEQNAVFRREYANALRQKLERYGLTHRDIEFDVLLWWPTMLFDTFIGLLAVDMGLVVFSIMFVSIYMAVHTRSCFLSGAAMLHILMSLPMAFCIYSYIFRIEVFYFLEFMSVYIILAIGADDVFVFMDAFNQFSFLPLGDRLRQAYFRASKAMLITSLTTCCAFLVTAINSLNDIACFGIFTALLVFINFMYVITYYTATVMFYEKYVHHCCCVCNTEKVVPSNGGAPFKIRVLECCICDAQRRQFYIDRNVKEFDKELEAMPLNHKIESMSNQVKSQRRAALSTARMPRAVKGFQSSPNSKEMEQTPPKKAFADEGEAKLVKEQKEEEEVVLSSLEKCCGGPFYNFIIGWPKYLFVAILTLAAVGGIGCATQLTYTTETEQALQENHPMQRWINSRTNDFPSSSDSTMKKVSIVFGLKSPYEDRTGVSRYSQEDPVLVTDKTFDVSTPEAQKFLVQICAELPTAKEGKEFLVRQNTLTDQKQEVNCFMTGLKKWVDKNKRDWPIPKNEFSQTLKVWLGERLAWRKMTFPAREHPPHERYESLLYFDPKDTDVIKYAVINMNSTMGSFAAEYQSTVTAYNSWEKWMKKKWEGAPAELKGAFHTNKGRENAWVFMHTQEVLLSGAFIGISVSLAIAYVVMTISTFNPYLAFLATLNIAFVVCCILGGTWLRGWEMGTIESISATILVGLSVDYVVHFANAYMESDTGTRLEALQDALIDMGGTILGGAITSLGASFMLFICQFQYFAKFGFFMFLTIFLSFIYVFLFFAPLLAIIGPDKNCCAFCDLRPKTLKQRFGGKKSAKIVQVQTAPTMASIMDEL